jgi:dihydroxyacetone kinase
VAFLGKARAAHHSADILEKSQDLEAAVQVLSGLVDGSHKVPDRAEAKEVVADTRARLADLKSQLGRFAEASTEVSKGMGIAKAPSYFRGHLLEMKGLVAERLAKDLAARGDTEAAKRAEADALEAFEEAMHVQQQVIDEALPDQAPK